MTTWFTADTHFAHENVIKYCDRPYPNKYEMDYDLIRLWNETVAPDDIIWHLGDVAMNKNRVSEIVPKLNGTKYLIAGNHDKCWSLSDKWCQFYLEAGFEGISLIQHFTMADQEIVATHMPYRNMDDPDQRYQEQRIKNEGKWLLHGHVHDRWLGRKKQINVGVDVWDMKPVSFEAIEQLIKDNPNGFPDKESKLTKDLNY